MFDAPTADRDNQYPTIDSTSRPAFHSHSHRFSNLRIWLDSPDKARSETYGDVTLPRIDGEGKGFDLRNLGR